MPSLNSLTEEFPYELDTAIPNSLGEETTAIIAVPNTLEGLTAIKDEMIGNILSVLMWVLVGIGAVIGILIVRMVRSR